MGLILDSSIVIAAERRGETVTQLIQSIVSAAGDQEAALSAIGLTELIHGLYRASRPDTRKRRESFINELLADLTVYPYTDGLSLHERDRIAGRQDRWRATEPRRGDPIRGPVDRSHSASARLRGADSEPSRFSPHTWPVREPTLDSHGVPLAVASII